MCCLHRCTLKNSCTILGFCTQPTIFNSIDHLPAHTGAERNLYICIIPACKPIMKSLSMNSRILHCSWSQQMRRMFKTCLFWTIAFDYVQWCTHFTVFRCSKHPKNKILNNSGRLGPKQDVSKTLFLWPLQIPWISQDFVPKIQTSFEFGPTRKSLPNHDISFTGCASFQSEKNLSTCKGVVGTEKMQRKSAKITIKKNEFQKHISGMSAFLLEPSLSR